MRYPLKIFIYLVLVIFFSILLNSSKTYAANPKDVVINELMWMGSSASSRDEWIELRNMTDQEIDLSGWVIENASSNHGTLTIPSKGQHIIPARGYYLISRYSIADNIGGTKKTQLNVIVDWRVQDMADISLSNDYKSNGALSLRDKDGTLIDQTPLPTDSKWPAGEYNKTNNIYYSMERNLDPGDGTLVSSWHTARESVNWDLEATEKGTPKAENSLPNQPPVAVAGNDQRIILGQVVNFSSTRSYDPDGKIVSYYWDFGDGDESEEANPPHQYNKVGQFTVTLEVTDNEGETSSDEVIITVDWPIYSSNILINELLPNPAGEESTDEYIELYNKGDTPVDLAGWKVADASGSYYVISPQHFATTIIPAGGYFVLYRDITGIALNNTGGETLYLYSPDGQEKDKVSYSQSAEEGYSYNRTSSGWQWSETPTPGAANIINLTEDLVTSSSSKSSKSKSTKSSGLKTIPSVLGARSAEAASSNNPSSYHFSETVNSEKDLSFSDRRRILAWFLMIGSFISLVIFRFLLWRKNYLSYPTS